MGQKKIYKYQVRLTRDQYEMLKDKARLRGFSHLSSYVRFMTLDVDMLMERKIEEIHQHLFGEPRLTKQQRKRRSRTHPEAVWSK